MKYPDLRPIYLSLSAIIFCLFCIICGPNVHANLPNGVGHTLSPVIKKTMPSVVAISGLKRVNMNSAAEPKSYFAQQEEQIMQGFGSGVVINAEKGHILTNAHVVADLDDLYVLLHDKQQFSAELIGLDKTSDLALLKINAKNLKAITFADSDMVEIGDFVIAIGNPFRLTHTVTSGIVSALSRHNLAGNGYYDYIQTDAAINVGNSGGALLNLKGELIGINTMILTPPGGGNVGLAFALPSNTARSIVSQLAEGGRVLRSPLGAYAQDLTPVLQEAFSLKTSQGALVTQITPNSPANSAGLQIADVILKVDDKPIKNSAHLRTQISLIPSESNIKLTVNRGGKTLVLPVKMKALFDNQAKGEKIFSGLAGCLLEETPPDYPIQGIRVLHIDKDAQAVNAGLFPGDVIVGANQRLTPSLEALSLSSQQDKNLLLLQVFRNKMPMFVALKK